MFDFTPIVQAFAALLAATVTAAVVPYVKSRTTAAQQQEIKGWVRIAVSAAEQIYDGPGRGVEKKQYVLCWLRGRGVTADEKQLDALVEAAVYELKNGFLAIGGGALMEGGGDG